MGDPLSLKVKKSSNYKDRSQLNTSTIDNGLNTIVSNHHKGQHTSQDKKAVTGMETCDLTSGGHKGSIES